MLHLFWFNFLVLSCHNAMLILCLGLAKKLFIWVRKMSWFGFKYLACHPKNKWGLLLKMADF